MSDSPTNKMLQDLGIIDSNQHHHFHFCFENKDLVEEYRSYSRKLFDFSSTIPIAVFYLVFIISNYNLQNVFNSSFYFLVVFILVVIGYIIFAIFLFCEAIKRIYDKSEDSPMLLIRIYRRLENSVLGRHKESCVSVIFSFIAGLILYARVDAGDCENVSSLWSTQSCNPGALCGLIPLEQVIFAYMTPIMAQTCLRAVSFQSSVLSWVATTSFVIASIIKVDSWKNYWLIICSLIFLYIIYEFERGFRTAFRLSKQTLDHHHRQQSLQHDLSVAALANQHTQHEKAVLEVQALKDRQLADQEGSNLRSLIGNVAHDLKTPLQAIGMGADEIYELVAGLQEKYFHHMAQVDAAFKSAESSELDQSGPAPHEQVLEGLLEAATTISATVAFMSMTINRAIDFTKASHEIRLIPTYETIDLEQALAWPVRIMSALQRRIDVIVEPLPENINRFIISDKGWLTENLLCLLSNAIKYSNEGCTTIRCTLKEVSFTRSPSSRVMSEKSAANSQTDTQGKSEEKQTMFQVEVEDTGIGISAEMQTRLFTSFQQAQRMAGGTGLGLYSMKKRMEALKGECGVRGREDGLQGSCFWFHFPYRPDPLAAAHCTPHKDREKDRSRGKDREMERDKGAGRCPFTLATPASSPTATTTGVFFASNHSHRDSSHSGSSGAASDKGSSNGRLQPPLGSLSSVRLKPSSSQDRKGAILVVDDSMPILKMTSLSLTREGFTVTTAVNGSEALKHLLPSPNLPPASASAFSLVLMDLQMPVMDGLEAVRRFRAFEEAEVAAGRQWRRLPVIAMSANDDDATTSIVLSSGFDHFIPKPFSLDRFREACAAVLPDDT
mmetsp:Transcript_3412/g.5109  ORF Transcript_3412/g.5109 Transcript_3412/m.5109 type:complete len:838 (-) Transcript_3412:785-3298(-)